MGRKIQVEKAIWDNLNKWKELKKINDKIDNAEFWGIEEKLTSISEAAYLIKSKSTAEDGYTYAQEGFMRMGENADKMIQNVENLKLWRKSQDELQDAIVKEMKKFENNVHQLQDEYNGNKDDGDFLGIHIAGNPTNWW